MSIDSLMPQYRVRYVGNEEWTVIKTKKPRDAVVMFVRREEPACSGPEFDRTIALKVEIDAFQEGWEDEFECFDSEDELRRFSLCDEDES